MKPSKGGDMTSRRTPNDPRKALRIRLGVWQAFLKEMDAWVVNDTDGFFTPADLDEVRQLLKRAQQVLGRLMDRTGEQR